MAKIPIPRVPRLLWKYCGTRAVPILEKMELKVTRPSEFNDPFEWSPTISRAVGVADVHRFYENPEWVARWDPPPLDLKDDAAVNETAKTMTAISEELMAGRLEERSQKSGFLCLSSDPANVLMWSHYAENHHGFVIGLNHRVFAGIQFYPVRYSKRRVGFHAATPFELHPKVRAFEIYTRKSLDWAYEREYRLVWKLEDLPARMINGVEARVMPLIPEAIAEVRLGNRASEKLERDIRIALEAWKCKAKVVRAKLNPRLYKLDFS